MTQTKQNLDFKLSDIAGRQLDIIVYSQKPTRGKLRLDGQLLELVERIGNDFISVRSFVLDYTLVEKLDDKTYRLIDCSKKDKHMPFLGLSFLGGEFIYPHNSWYKYYDSFLGGN